MVFSTLLEQGRPNDLPSKRCLCHLELIAYFACKTNALRDLIVPAATISVSPSTTFPVLAKVGGLFSSLTTACT